MAVDSTYSRIRFRKSEGIAAKDIYVAEDFAIQHHGDGLFDLAFVVEPLGNSLFTEKMVEMSEFSLEAGTDRFGRVMSSFYRKNAMRMKEFDPSINDMAFDVRRQRAYIATIRSMSSTWPSLSRPIVTLMIGGRAHLRLWTSSHVWHR